MEGTVNHTYRTKEVVTVSVEVAYRGRYRIGNGAWQDMPGTLTVAGESEELQVRTARPALVG